MGLRADAEGPSDLSSAGSKTTKKKTKKRRTKKKAAAKAEPASPPPEGERYFELVDDKSNKFWAISLDGVSYTARYGRIGSNGQSKTKEAASEAAAQAAVDKLIAQKTGKGYLEK